MKDLTADKASLCSGRSFRSSERSYDLDSNSLSSMHKRIVQRIPKLNSQQHRTLSVDSNNGSNNIPETLELEVNEEAETKSQEFIVNPPAATASVKLSPASSVSSIKSTNSKISPQPLKKKGMSKSNILRNLFFFQNADDSTSSSSKS